MKISLCLIVWNELEGCKLDVPQLPADAFDEVFAVDGGSSDGTVEYLESQGIPVYEQPERGLNAAYVFANEVAKNDSVVAFFPKGTYPTDDLKRFREYFEQGYELIVASRQIPGSVNEEDGHLLRPRKWAVFGLSMIAAALWRREGRWIRDVLHGFKGWSKKSFYQMDIQRTGLSIDIEMVIRSYKFKMNRVEFPTIEKYRQYGTTHFRIWPTGKKLLRYLIFELTRSSRSNGNRAYSMSSIKNRN